MPMIPIVASSDDLDEALRFAQLHPNARWYVADRARALDAADRIPEDWGIPAPVVAGLGRDAERAGHAFKSALHPRGKDGRFIEKGGRVVVDRPDGSKVEGTVSEVTSNTSVNVRLGDGSTLQGVKPSSISQAPTAKAHVAPVAAPNGLHPEDQSIHDAAHAATTKANESGHPSDHLDAAAAHNHAASRTAGYLQAEHQRATTEHIAAAQTAHQAPIRLEGNESIAITGPRAGQKIPDHPDAYRGADEERARATAQRQSVAEARNRDAAQYEAQQRAARAPEAKVVGGPDRLEYHDDEGNSHKFYESSVVDHGDGSYSHVTRWGRVGAKPSSKVDHYNDRTAAMEAHSKKYYEKRDKGYGKYGQGDAAAHAAEAEARHPGALAAKREADKAQVAKDHADAVDALNSDDSEWTAGRDASAPPAVKRTGPSTVDMDRAQLEEAIRNAPNETERANLQSVFDSRVRTLPGYGPRVAEEDRHDSGPTLRVSNEAQRVLMEHHIKGQISDGMWENANHGRGPNGEPGEGWKHWTDAKVVVDPEHTGRNFRPSKDNYQLNSSNLVGIVGDEMLQSVREATGNPNYSEKDLRKDLAGLSKHFKTRRDSIKAPDASGLPGEEVPSPAGGGTSRADELSQEAHEFIAGLKAPMSPEEYSHAASLHEEAADAHREAGNHEQAAHHDAEADRLSNLGLDREDELAQEGKLESPRGGLDIAAAKDMSDEELAQHVHDSRSLGGQEDYHQELADRGLSLGEARDTGRVHATAPDTTGRSTTKRAEDVAATGQHELHGVGRSAANKGVVPADVAQSRVNAILRNPDHEAAHRDLAKLMSEAKLGGKQRARYREVLNQHHGSSGSGRPAGSLAEDNMLRDRLAAKQNGGPLGGHPDTGAHPSDAAQELARSSSTESLMSELSNAHQRGDDVGSDTNTAIRKELAHRGVTVDDLAKREEQARLERTDRATSASDAAHAATNRANEVGGDHASRGPVVQQFHRNAIDAHRFAAAKHREVGTPESNATAAQHDEAALGHESSVRQAATGEYAQPDTRLQRAQREYDEAEAAVRDASKHGMNPRARALKREADLAKKRLNTARDREAKQSASAPPLQDDSVKRTQMEQLAGSYSDHELGAAVNRYQAGTMAGDVARAEKAKRDAIRARAAEQAQQTTQRRTNPAAVKHDAEYKPGQALFDSRFGAKVSESNLGPTVVVDDHTWHKGSDGQWRHSSSYGWGGTEFAKPTAGREGDASGVHATPKEAARLDELFNANIDKYRGMRKLERSGHSPEGFTKLTDDELAAVAKYYDSPGSGHDKAQAEIQRRQRAAISRNLPATTRAAEERRTTAISGLTDDALRARLRDDPTGPEASAISAELKARRQAKSTKTNFEAMSAAELESIAGDENNPKRPRARLELARRKREGKA